MTHRHYKIVLALVALSSLLYLPICFWTTPTNVNLNYSNIAPIKLTLQDRIANKNVILTFCNDQMLQVFQFWYSYYIQLPDVAHHPDYLLLVIALDHKSYYFIDTSVDKATSNVFVLNALNINTHINVSQSCSIPSHLDDDFFNHILKLVRFRECIVKILLKYTQSITMTDIDALWLQNPFHYFHSHDIDTNSIDLITSTGSFPAECPVFRARYGHIYTHFCMGFIHFRNTVHTNAFLQRFWNDVVMINNEWTGNDQLAFNCFVHQNMTREKQFFDLRREVIVAKFKYNYGETLAEGTKDDAYDLFAVPLEQKHFVRRCEHDDLNVDEIYVLHCWMDLSVRKEMRLQDDMARLRYYVQKFGI
eukprot:581792_1